MDDDASDLQAAAARSTAASSRSLRAGFQAVVVFAVTGIVAAAVGSHVRQGSASWWAVVACWVVPSATLFARGVVMARRSKRAEVAVYRLLDSAAAKQPILPYAARRTAWIGRGRTDFRVVDGGTGTIEVDSEHVRLLDAFGKVLASCAPNDVTVHRVFAWFGAGIRLDMGGRRWFVQPAYSRVAGFGQRHETRKLRQALHTAGQATVSAEVPGGHS